MRYAQPAGNGQSAAPSTRCRDSAAPSATVDCYGARARVRGRDGPREAGRARRRGFRGQEGGAIGPVAGEKVSGRGGKAGKLVKSVRDSQGLGGSNVRVGSGNVQ
nr:hypothetical protein CFP56_20466 [Quercus suber]